MNTFNWKTPTMEAKDCFFKITEYSDCSLKVSVFGTPIDSQTNKAKLLTTVTEKMSEYTDLKANQIIINDTDYNFGTMFQLVKMDILVSRDTTLQLRDHRLLEVCTFDCDMLAKYTKK